MLVRLCRVMRIYPQLVVCHVRICQRDIEKNGTPEAYKAVRGAFCAQSAVFGRGERLLATGDARTQQVLPESPETLETYTSDEIESIKGTAGRRRAKAFLGKINSETVAKIKEATGINADGKKLYVKLW